MFWQPSKLTNPFRKTLQSPLPSWEGIKGRGEVTEIINELPRRKQRGIKDHNGENPSPQGTGYSPGRNKVSLGFVEGLNNKIRVIQRRAYGLRDEEYLRLKVLTCMLPTL